MYNTLTYPQGSFSILDISRIFLEETRTLFTTAVKRDNLPNIKRKSVEYSEAYFASLFPCRSVNFNDPVACCKPNTSQNTKIIMVKKSFSVVT